jgi:predicted transcriptional regulator
MTLTAIQDLLQCEVLTGESLLHVEVEGALASDAMSAVLATPRPRALLITGLANVQSVRTALIAYMSAIVYVRGARPNATTIQLASDRQFVLLATPLGMFDSCGILRSAGVKGAI